MMVVNSLDLGGTERHVAQITPALRERGFEVSVFCLLRPGAQAESVRSHGVPVLGLAKAGAAAGRAAMAVRALRAAGTLTRAMRMARPSIAHFFLPLPYLVGASAAALARVPIRIMSRRSLNLYQAKYPGIAALERRLHRGMSMVLANSREVARELASEGVPPERLGLIYSGVDLARFTPRDDAERSAIRAALGIPPDALVLAMVANLIAYKGHADLLAGLGMIRARLPEPWRLLVIGRDDGEGPALAAQVTAAGIDRNVLFLGQRADVPQLLAAADIGLNASHEEGFSNAVIEGMGAGLPMIATRVGGNAEAVLEGVCGLLVAPRAPNELGAATLALAQDPALRLRMGQAARERAHAAFGLTACVERYAALYHALLEGRSPAPVGADGDPTA
jgi:glycosyltransferase involved in cell wall biosynthesis